MTTVDVVFRYAAQPSEIVARALAGIKDVYGIRAVRFDRAAETLTVEFDATRLNEATVTSLVRRAGLQVVEQLVLAVPAPPSEPPPAA
ncbi:MAG: hypothetical protein KGN79_01795 [Acidobacteriota bacterium]|nr:hypothetical protein [Acidobacteriota bacterium]